MPSRPSRRVISLPSVALTLGLAAACAMPSAFAQGSRQEQTTSRATVVIPGPSEGLLAQLASAYQDIHAHPELAMQEHRTAGIAAAWLRKQGYEVTEKIGGTGVVGVLRNGEGATVLLRADMDALPMKEDTGLPYASTKVVKDASGQDTPVAHSCGHDMHVAWLMGATRILADERDNTHDLEGLKCAVPVAHPHARTNLEAECVQRVDVLVISARTGIVIDRPHASAIAARAIDQQPIAMRLTRCKSCDAAMPVPGPQLGRVEIAATVQGRGDLIAAIPGSNA